MIEFVVATAQGLPRLSGASGKQTPDGATNLYGLLTRR
jgi:hypothetical protein